MKFYRVKYYVDAKDSSDTFVRVLIDSYVVGDDPPPVTGQFIWGFPIV